MGEPSKDSQTPKTDAEKKQSDTVLLTPEELRAIAGGGGVVIPPPPRTQDVVAGQNKGTHQG